MKIESKGVRSVTFDNDTIESKVLTEEPYKGKRVVIKPYSVEVVIYPTTIIPVKDDTNICVIIGEMDAEIKPFYTTEDTYKSDLETIKQSLDPASKIYLTGIDLALSKLDEIFSTSSMYRKQYLLIGFAQEGFVDPVDSQNVFTTDWDKFFDQREINNLLYFTWILYQTPRTGFKNLTSFIQWCNSNIVFWAFEENNTSITNFPKEVMGIPFVHKQLDVNQNPVEGGLMNRALPILCRWFEAFPNFNTYCTLDGTTLLYTNIYNKTERAIASNLNANLYQEVNGLNMLVYGQVATGKKIEEIYSTQVYIPSYVKRSLMSWFNGFKSQGGLHENLLPVYRTKLDSVMIELEEANITTPIPELNNQSYRIDSIDILPDTQTGGVTFVAEISFSYNRSVTKMRVSGTVVYPVS